MQSAAQQNIESTFDIAAHVSTRLNETFELTDGSYLHVSPRLNLESEQKALLLDRYTYPNKGSAIAAHVLAITESTAAYPVNVRVPRVVDAGTIHIDDESMKLDYWIDERVHGRSGKELGRSFSEKQYNEIVDWVVAIQDSENADKSTYLAHSYQQRAMAARQLFNEGHYSAVLSMDELALLSKAIDVLWQMSQNLDGVHSVRHHGDLHAANIVLDEQRNRLSVVDFEAGIAGPGDNLKDLFKLLHFDYDIFAVTRTPESSYLDASQKNSLLERYVSRSNQPGVEALMYPEELRRRLIIDGIHTNISRVTFICEGTSVGISTQRALNKVIRNLSALLEE